MPDVMSRLAELNLTLPKPARPVASYIPTVRTGNLVFISGQVPEDEQQQVPDDYRAQYRLAWANVERQLKAAGMSFDDLVKVNIYLSDRKWIAHSAGLRAEILGERSPALTIVICGIYDERWLLEIEAVAAAA